MLQNRDTASWNEADEHCKKLAMVPINRTDVDLFRRAENLKAEMWTKLTKIATDSYDHKQYWLAKYGQFMYSR